MTVYFWPIPFFGLAPRRVRRRRARARSSVPSAGAQGAEFLRQDRVQPGRDARRERVVRPRGARVARGDEPDCRRPRRCGATSRAGSRRADWCHQDARPSRAAPTTTREPKVVWTIGGPPRAEGGAGVSPASVEVGGFLSGSGAGWRGDGAGRRGGPSSSGAGGRGDGGGEEEALGRREARGGGANPSPSSLAPRPSSSNDPRCRTPAAARGAPCAPPSAARRSPVSGGAWIRAALEEGRFFAAAARMPGRRRSANDSRGGTTRAREPPRAVRNSTRDREREPRPRPATLRAAAGRREGRRARRRAATREPGRRAGGSGSIPTYFTPRRARHESDEDRGSGGGGGGGAQ